MKIMLLCLALLAGECHFHSHRDTACDSTPKCGKCHRTTCSCDHKAWKKH